MLAGNLEKAGCPSRGASSTPSRSNSVYSTLVTRYSYRYRSGTAAVLPALPLLLLLPLTWPLLLLPLAWPLLLPLAWPLVPLAWPLVPLLLLLLLAADAAASSRSGTRCCSRTFIPSAAPTTRSQEAKPKVRPPACPVPASASSVESMPAMGLLHTAGAGIQSGSA